MAKLVSQHRQKTQLRDRQFAALLACEEAANDLEADIADAVLDCRHDRAYGAFV